MISVPRLVSAVFLCSLSSLAYELVLTRIFSISLWYHFAFMIVSIAMLGIAASGTFLSLFPGLRSPTNICVYAIFAGVGISASYLLSNQIPFDPVRLAWDRAQLFYISLYYVALSVPFFFTGLIVATAFSCLSGKSGLVYSGDLLGAGVGSAAVLVLLTWTAPERVPFVLSSLVLCAALITGGTRIRVVAAGLIVLNVVFLLLRPDFIALRMSPYKGLEAALRFPGAEHLKTYNGPFSRIDTFRSPAVRFAPGLSLRYLDALPDQLGISVDGSEVSAVTAADGSTLPFLDYLPSALPYELAVPDSVLVLDPKGGLQVLVAERHGAGEVYKVESNPLLVEVMQTDLAEFSGGIYERNAWARLGRSWLQGSGKTFDIIDIPLMGSMASGAFGIAEDYRFTVEAFSEYVSRLKEDGYLAVHLYMLPPPRLELRLLATLIAAVEESGAGDVRAHLIALRSLESITMVLKKSPLSPEEIEKVRDFSRDTRFDLVYVPGVREEETNRYVRMPSNEYFHLFQDMLDRGRREKFLESYIFDVRPVRDDAPFFHYYLSLKNAADIYRTMGRKWQYFIEEGYLLPVVFAQVLVLGFLVVVVPAIAQRRSSGDRAGPCGGQSLLPYFAFLGLGYLFVEITIIQKMILTLETPSYAVAAVLISLLVASGIGSFASQRMRGPGCVTVLLWVAVLIAVASIVLPVAGSAIASQELSVKVGATFLLLLPLGLLMGIPFPLGLRVLGERSETLIPWAWAINGCFSVLAPLLAVMLAMVVGFKGVLWLGALCYLAAYFLLRLFLKKRDNVGSCTGSAPDSISEASDDPG